MLSVDSLDHPKIALHRAFELHDSRLVGRTVVGLERLFEAQELDDDGASVDAGLESPNLPAAREEVAAAGLDRRPREFRVFRQRVRVLDAPLSSNRLLSH